MPEQREITVYKYEELEGQAQERARMKVGEWNAEWENECLQGLFEEYLLERGLPTDKLEWSLGYSQGDGVAFYGEIDVEKCLRFRRRFSYYRRVFRRDEAVYARIHSNSNFYSHANTMDVECDNDPLLWEELQEYVRRVSQELEKMGYEALEYAYSDEAVKDSCDANEYRFDARGNIV